MPYLIPFSNLFKLFLCYICDLFHHRVSFVHIIFVIIKLWEYFGRNFALIFLVIDFFFFCFLFTSLLFLVTTIWIVWWFFVETAVSIAFVFRILWILWFLIQHIVTYDWGSCLHLHCLLLDFLILLTFLFLFFRMHPPTVYFSCFCLSDALPCERLLTLSLN